MSLEEVARHFGVGRSTVYAEAAQLDAFGRGWIAGDIPVIQIGATKRCPRELVENIVERRRAERLASTTRKPHDRTRSGPSADVHEAP
jgi:transposase